MRLPVFVPIIFMIRPWIALNPQGTLTNTEADVLGSGGVLCFYIALSITPLITLTGAQWIAPLRRWYGIWFAVIGIADSTTASITTDFNGGVFGRLAGHTFLLAGFLIILLAIPLLATANTPAQRKLGKWWKRLQRMTYVIWGFVVLHLLLLDGFQPFGAADGDGDPVFHQRFYQAVAISIPLIILRLPPVRRWIIEQRTQGRQWLVWLTVAPFAVFYVTAMAFIVNEEIFTGTMAITLHPPAD
jgi:DMSO/TMAO reductase YedYZ heme-binding membrane subunit